MQNPPTTTLTTTHHDHQLDSNTKCHQKGSGYQQSPAVNLSPRNPLLCISSRHAPQALGNACAAARKRRKQRGRSCMPRIREPQGLPPHRGGPGSRLQSRACQLRHIANQATWQAPVQREYPRHADILRKGKGPWDPAAHRGLPLPLYSPARYSTAHCHIGTWSKPKGRQSRCGQEQ